MTITKAQDACAASHALANNLLEDIGAALQDLPAPDERTNWQHVGTLHEVIARLNAVVSLLDGTEC